MTVGRGVQPEQIIFITNEQILLYKDHHQKIQHSPLASIVNIMTRATDFGRKRTYVAAGFASEPQESTNVSATAASIPQESHNAVDIADQPPPKKKRKRTKMSKRDGNAAKNAAGELSTEGVAVVPKPTNGGEEGEAKEVGPSKTTAKKNKKKRQKRTPSITYHVASSDGRG